jgi:hypothetical protein
MLSGRQQKTLTSRHSQVGTVAGPPTCLPGRVSVTKSVLQHGLVGNLGGRATLNPPSEASSPYARSVLLVSVWQTNLWLTRTEELIVLERVAPSTRSVPGFPRCINLKGLTNPKGGSSYFDVFDGFYAY